MIKLDVLMQQNAVVLHTVFSKKLRKRSDFISRCTQ